MEAKLREARGDAEFLRTLFAVELSAIGTRDEAELHLAFNKRKCRRDTDWDWGNQTRAYPPRDPDPGLKSMFNDQFGARIHKYQRCGA